MLPFPLWLPPPTNGKESLLNKVEGFFSFPVRLVRALLSFSSVSLSNNVF